MKMEYEIRRRITKIRESEAFLYILGYVCVRNIEIAKESLCFWLYYDTLAFYLSFSVSEKQLTTVYLVMICQRDKKQEQKDDYMLKEWYCYANMPLPFLAAHILGKIQANWTLSVKLKLKLYHIKINK